MELFFRWYLVPILAFFTILFIYVAIRFLLKKKVLIADDDKEIRENLRTFLEQKGHWIYIASSIESAREIIEKKKLDYAIIDLVFDPSKQNKDKFEGIKIFKFLRNKQPSAKPVILSVTPFAETKEPFKEELKGEFEPEKLLKEIEENYVWKAGEKNYLLEVLNKLAI
jgi:DNA-binding NtrC family response regulator